MKRCAKCGLQKQLGDFNKNSRSKTGRHSYCRACSKLDYRQHAERHKAAVRRNKARYRERAREVIAAELMRGCADCGNADIRVLEFDHVSNKVYNISEMVSAGMPPSRLAAELAKCEVRCCNCHRIKTFERSGNSWRDKYLGL